MGTYVLVHGSWHEGAHWAEVAAHLRDLGHTVHTPTLSGFGKAADKDVGHADCVRSLVDYFNANDLREAVLLGHSFGGSVVAVAAPQVADRLTRLIFQNGFIPEHGNSVMDECPPSFRDIWENARLEGRDSVELDFAVWRDEFIGDADLALARRTYELLSPTPRRPSVDKLDMTAFYELDLPMSYLNCLDDMALPPGEWGWHPRMSSRLGGYRLIQMHGSHETMFSNPRALADKIVEAGRP